jgi:hypothetical protein
VCAALVLAVGFRPAPFIEYAQRASQAAQATFAEPIIQPENAGSAAPFQKISAARPIFEAERTAVADH